MKKKGWVAAGVIALISTVVLMIAFFSGEPEMQVSDGKPEGTNANYDLNLEMDEEGLFTVSSVIEVTNDSDDAWEEVGFYLVPNAMNAVETHSYRDLQAEIELFDVLVDGEPADFTLDNNELMLQLPAELETGGAVEVTVDYSLKVPEDGMRLAQVDNNFYLAHWYPMLAVYDNGWDIEDYDPKGESYDTGYGNYTVSYQLPEEYLVASSADDGELEAAASGELEGDNYKDFYIAFMNPEEWQTGTVQTGDTDLRVFMPADVDLLEETVALAKETYSYFEKEIGDNPFSELDIIANDGYMEYPNVIEVATEREAMEPILIHEIAHQWFYFLATNNPFEDAWLDESVAEFATALFISERNGDTDSGFRDASLSQASHPPEKYVNLPLDEFEEAAYYSTVYGKGPLMLKEFFDANGGREKALEFLSDYYAAFQFKTVDSEDFRTFFEDYFDGDQSEFLDSWIEPGDAQ
ncbi:M1 family metallopeptidase [Planomicrobium sp. Y74]|uniref:M1 family metallopeptidase n=1 Tax=Planomicrobium sp. Y74 TaxID=2478977 RepID=UPI000EF4CBC1|nr:M1 family metallopeptidase [Planomicrobium sp. Y74]RLQ89889.1 M1 family peptidase [Planomicrobium sp. Y74]